MDLIKKQNEYQLIVKENKTFFEKEIQTIKTAFNFNDEDVLNLFNYNIKQKNVLKEIINKKIKIENFDFNENELKLIYDDEVKKEMHENLKNFFDIRNKMFKLYSLSKDWNETIGIKNKDLIINEKLSKKNKTIYDLLCQKDINHDEILFFGRFLLRKFYQDQDKNLI